MLYQEEIVKRVNNMKIVKYNQSHIIKYTSLYNNFNKKGMTNYFFNKNSIVCNSKVLIFDYIKNKEL